MATIDDIYNGMDTTPAYKGSQEWSEQQESNPPVTEPVKGSQEWAEQNSGENAPPSAPAQKKESPASDTTTPTEGGGMSYVEMYKALNPYEPPTKEELEKEKKKQKREQIFNAIGDGIYALSNLFFTSQYAPNMYKKGQNLTAQAQARYDKLMKEREQKDEKYRNGMWQAMLADQRKGEADREWQRQLGLDEYRRKRDDAKDTRDQQLFELNVQLQGHKIEAADAEAKRKGIEAEYAEALAKAKVDTEKARGEAQQASAASHRATASASSARAGYYGSKTKRMSLKLEGTVHYYDTEEDYERAVQREAKKLGIETHQNVETTETEGRRSKKKVVSTPKPISQLAGEVEEKSNAPKPKQSPTNTSDEEQPTTGSVKKSPTA